MKTKQIFFTEPRKAELWEVESYPHHWTHQDDCKAILDLLAAKRIQVGPVLSRVVSPNQAPEIFDQLANDKNFPMGTVFDWRNLSLKPKNF